jgi:tRNA (guanine-N7-)-methyltransferase
MTPRRLPRSAHAEKLRAYPDFVLNDEVADSRRGLWRNWFAPRIGSTFNQKLIVEVGCSNGTFLTEVASAHPATAFVGIDWKCKPLCEAADRVLELKLPNVALVRGRGQEIGELFAPAEIDELWLFHPDPCDGALERPNRLMGEPFLTEVHHLLGDGGLFCLKTDHPGYYQWTLALFGLPQPAWTSPREARHVLEAGQLPAAGERVKKQFRVTVSSGDYWRDSAALEHTAGRAFAGRTTVFEERFRRRGLPIYYFEVRKQGLYLARI